MTEIKPFQAIYYNPLKVQDLSKVVCPPYDVITKQQQNVYYNLSEHNFIRILLGKERSMDDKTDNKYTRAKQLFDQWLKEGVFKEDESPCIYYYKQEYKLWGQRYSRLGFISLMKIQDEKDSRIYPHENVHSSAKEDRLKLWRSLSSNCSAIFLCFSDKEKTVEKIFVKYVSLTNPFINIVDEDGVRHILWRLDDPKFINQIVDSLERQQLFIADGHHRYEVAKEYRRARLVRSAKANGKEPYNYVMTYFTNMDSKDLKILPLHRIVKRLTKKLDFLEEHFRIDKIRSQGDLLILLAKAGQNEHAFGLYTKNGAQLLRLKNTSLIDKIIREGSKEFRHLDATILKYFIFDRLNIKSEDIIYTKDFPEAIALVDNGQADASFIMNPVSIKQLKEIALQGERMPPKTTYFYPKVLSGLTIYKMG